MERCREVLREVEKTWGTGWSIYKCDKPFNHKSLEHIHNRTQKRWKNGN